MTIVNYQGNVIVPQEQVVLIIFAGLDLPKQTKTQNSAIWFRQSSHSFVAPREQVVLIMRVGLNPDP